MAGATMKAGIVSGMAAGAVAGGVMTGSPSGVVRGALTGGLAGGVNAYWGHRWTLSRVAANSVTSGVSSEIAGGRFKDGFRFALAVSTLTYVNYQMRQAMIRQSSLNTDHSNIDGVSAGLHGDGIKLGGARRIYDRVRGYLLPCGSPLGGCQGAPLAGDQGPNIFGIPYSPGSIGDMMVESFAGPHDWLRSASGAYTALGNAWHLSGFNWLLDQSMNAILLAPAAPFGVAGAVHPGSYWAFSNRRGGR